MMRLLEQYILCRIDMKNNRWCYLKKFNAIRSCTTYVLSKIRYLYFYSRFFLILCCSLRKNFSIKIKRPMIDSYFPISILNFLGPITFKRIQLDPIIFSWECWFKNRKRAGNEGGTTICSQSRSVSTPIVIARGSPNSISSNLLNEPSCEG